MAILHKGLPSVCGAASPVDIWWRLEEKGEGPVGTSSSLLAE